MAVRGTISDYGLADVLQLIKAGTRSGRLAVERSRERIELFIAAAAVVEVQADLPSDTALGARLVEAGLLTEDQLGWALAERARTGYPLGHFLAGGGRLDPETVHSHALLQRWETVLTPFTWPTGRYTFEDIDVSGIETWAPPISVDELLLRGLRLIEDWPNAEARVPSRTWTVARRLPLGPPRTSSAARLPTSESPLGLPTEDEGPGEELRLVHRLAAPGTSVGAVLGVAPFDRYETTLLLAELIDRGVLVLSPP